MTAVRVPDHGENLSMDLMNHVMRKGLVSHLISFQAQYGSSDVKTFHNFLYNMF